MLEKAREHIAAHLPRRSTPIVVAASAGVDSMVLLSLLIELSYSNIHVVHIHHGLRTEADLDVVLLEKYAEQHKLTLHVEYRDVQAEAMKNKSNMENTGRTVRYTILENIRSTLTAPWILLGHHQNDLVESQLMHIMRGSDLFGLVGFRSSDSTRHILRPLRSHSKNDILQYAQYHSLRWNEDISNADTRFKRNHLRRHIMPQLQKQFPDILQNMEELSTHTSSILDRIYGNLVSKLGQHFEQQESWSIDKLALCTPEELSYALLWLLRFWKPGSTYTSSSLIPRALELTTVQSGKAIQLTKDFTLQRSFDEIHISRPKKIPHSAIQFASIPEHISFADVHIHFTRERNPTSNILCPISLLENGFAIRTRQSGDKLSYRSQGVLFHKPLKKYLSEQKIPMNKRDTLPLVVDTTTGEIVAILDNSIYYRHPKVDTDTDIITLVVT